MGEGKAGRLSQRKERDLKLPSLPPVLPPSGAAIITATAIQDFYGILGAFGMGFDWSNTAGVIVTSYVAINQVGQEGGRRKGWVNVPRSPK